jgi:hypothetical protein
MTLIRGDLVYPVDQPGTAGVVQGFHTDGDLFRVDWSDGTVSIESLSEEHATWEKV